MFDSSSFVNPTPLAHADTSRDVLPRGGTSQSFEINLGIACETSPNSVYLSYIPPPPLQMLPKNISSLISCLSNSVTSTSHDEAHFWLNGYVNKQNCRIWSEANPQVYVETPLHPEKLTGAIYGLVESFFKNDEGHNVTVNGDRYRAMITNFFIPELNNHDVQELWFQQDGAICHTACATINLLKDTFGDRLISRFGPVIENWTSRLDYIRASRGSHMPEIIFKM
ncbi:transposable element Tc3 transposase [Trichonephila clavipes]|nr:transposable element Tc3 transposase [Trichonephila clavipes]